MDTALGVKVVRRFVKEAGLSQLWVVGSREAGEDEDYVLAYSPRKRDKEFRIFGYGD